MAGFAYDSTLGGLVLFGGIQYDGSYHGNYLDDTWLWDGSNWSVLSPATPPTPWAVDLSVNPGGGLILHGGQSCKDQKCIQSDSFVIANGEWSVQTAGGRPGAIQGMCQGFTSPRNWHTNTASKCELSHSHIVKCTVR